jgi:RHS repeat-associated protein
VRNRWYPGANRKVKVEWDFEDRLVRVVKDGVVVENVYDADGVLVKSGGVEYLVDTSGGLSHVVAEVNSGAVGVVYVRAGDMLLEEVRGGVAKMHEAEGLGSVRGMLDATGARTDTWSYEAFGTTVGQSGSSANPYRFAGERWVADAGMYQNRARWLDTRVGRFVSVDPATGSPGFPTSWHPYAYAGLDPILHSDPSGLSTLSEQALINLVMAHQWVLRNSVALTAIGAIGAGLLLPTEWNDALNSVPGANVVTRAGKAEARAIQLIKNSLTDRFVRKTYKLTAQAVGELAGEFGKTFEIWAKRYLLPTLKPAEKIVYGAETAVPDGKLAHYGEEILVEFKTTTAFDDRAMKQLALYQRYVGEQVGRRFVYIFLEEPGPTILSKIWSAGGEAFYVFREVPR